MKAHGLCGFFCFFRSDGRVKKRNLVKDRAGNQLEILLYVSEKRTLYRVRKACGVLSADENLSFGGTIKAQKKFENCAFSGAGAAGKSYVFSPIYGERKVGKDRGGTVIFIIRKAYILEGNAGLCIVFYAFHCKGSVCFRRSGRQRNSSMRRSPAMADWIV